LLLALNGDDLFACPTQLVHHWVDQVDAISDFFPILNSSRLPSPEKLQGFSLVDEFSSWLPFMVTLHGAFRFVQFAIRGRGGPIVLVEMFKV
jgi:hypothetical protein